MAERVILTKDEDSGAQVTPIRLSDDARAQLRSSTSKARDHAVMLRADALKKNLANVRTKRPVYRQKRTAVASVALGLSALALVLRLNEHSSQAQRQHSAAYLTCIANDESRLATGLPTTPLDPLAQAASDCSQFAN